MVKTTVYLNKELALDLKHLAEIEGRSQAELIREALKAFTSRKRRPMPTGMGEFHSGANDTSMRAKEILREAAKLGKWRA
jgi:predicted transcriptional regulator